MSVEKDKKKSKNSDGEDSDDEKVGGKPPTGKPVKKKVKGSFSFLIELL